MGRLHAIVPAGARGLRVLAPAFFLALAGCGTSVWDAARWGETETVRAILAQDPGAVNEKNPRGKTPLHEAVGSNRTETVKLLIANGADLGATDKTGMTPLHVAAMWNRAEQVAILLDAGADLDARDKFGDTPLHTAAVFGSKEAIRALVERGADIHAANATGQTPLQAAVQWRRQEAADLLRELGAAR